MVPVSQTEAQAFVALRSLLLGILPSNTEVIRAEINRVPEPLVPNFVTMTPLLRRRLETNVSTVSEMEITASITGLVMTVTALIDDGTLQIGQALAGPGVATQSVITALGTGSGGTGTYAVEPTQTLPSGSVWAGARAVLQATEVTVQLDIHGPLSADNAQRISTLFRDQYACDALGAVAAPFYASDPRQTPFVNSEQQYEYRWTVDVLMQVNPVVTLGQQFADTVTVGVLNVDVVYPP